MVRRSKGHESRWIRCENRRVSRQIVDTVAVHGGVLHLEKLLGICDRTKKTRKVNRMPGPSRSFSASSTTRRHGAGSAADAGIWNEAADPGRQLFNAKPAAMMRSTRT